MTKEGDLLAVWRPSRQVGLHRRGNKLKFLSPVNLTSPHRATGTVIVGDPHSITREVQSHSRDSRKIRRALSSSRVVPYQFPSGPPALDEKSFAVPAGDGISNIHRPSR